MDRTTKLIAGNCEIISVYYRVWRVASNPWNLYRVITGWNWLTGFEFEVCLYFMSQLRGCQTLDYNPTLYLLGIDGFQCRSYCMHAELWHTTYCCTVADLASIFLNVKRLHCMCKLSTFLPFSKAWLFRYNGKVSVVFMLLPPHICICIIYVVTPSRPKKMKKIEPQFSPKVG